MIPQIQLGPDPNLWPEPLRNRYFERLRAKRSTNSPFEKYQSDPQGYARDVLGVRLTPDQHETLQSIRDNRRTLVKASHAIGKTFTASVAASWWYDCWNRHIAYITAPTWPQALGLTFKQLKTLRRAKQLSGTILDTGIIKDEDKAREGEHYVRALNAERGEGFQGEHAAPILIVIEEGVGVPKYIWDAAGGLMTHPECFVGETMVSASEIKAATSRFYQGRMIKIATAHGRNLTVTPNHPILTRRGWVAARAVKEGDQLIASSDVQAVTSRIVPNKENVPTAISKVFASLAGFSRDLVRKGSRLQFHGDGADSEVNVIRANCFLRDELNTPLAHEIGQSYFPRSQFANALNGDRSALKFRSRSGSPSHGVVRGLGHLQTGSGTHSAHTQGVSLADVSSLSSQRGSDGSDRCTVVSGELSESLSGRVFSSEGRRSTPSLACASPTQNDSARTEVSGQSFTVGSDLVCQLLAMFPGEVSLDQVVEVGNDSFSGQVYNLQTDTDWYFANGIVAHNCRMLVIGNPTDEATEFGLASESDLYHTLSISALDHPNITAELNGEPPPFPDAVRLQWLYEMLTVECEVVDKPIEDAFEFVALPEIKKALEGQRADLNQKWIYMPTAYFQGRVLGEFPTQADQQVIPKAWLKFQPVQEPADSDIPELGCDVARFGDDRTTIFTRRGPCVYAGRELRKMDNLEVSSGLRDAARDAPKLTGKDIDPKRIKIKIDITGGLGTGPHDILKGEGYNVIGVNSSSKANNEEQYKNKRSELWFDTRARAREKRLDLSRLRKDIRERLERELSAPKYKSPGQKVVEDKAAMKVRLGYSPDLADGANLAFAEGTTGGRVVSW